MEKSKKIALGYTAAALVVIEICLYFLLNKNAADWPYARFVCIVLNLAVIGRFFYLRIRSKEKAA